MAKPLEPSGQLDRGQSSFTGVVILLSNSSQTLGNLRVMAGKQVKSDAYGDVLRQIEEVTGSPFRDRISGDKEANTLTGGAYRYASYDGDINFTALKHGSAGNEISVNMYYDPSTQLNRPGGTVGVTSVRMDDKTVFLTPGGDGFTLGQLEPVLNKLPGFTALASVSVDDGDGGIRYLPSQHLEILSASASLILASGTDQKITFTNTSAGTALHIEFLSDAELGDSVRIKATGNHITVFLSERGARLKDIKTAIESHKPANETGDTVAAATLVSVTVNTDGKLAVFSHSYDTELFELSGGGSGDDVLSGGAGDDILNGVDGDNTLYGDGGADRFVLNRKASGTTTVKDFADGTDKTGCILIQVRQGRLYLTSSWPFMPMAAVLHLIRRSLMLMMPVRFI